jgi:hypothetical protein
MVPNGTVARADSDQERQDTAYEQRRAILVRGGSVEDHLGKTIEKMYTRANLEVLEIKIRTKQKYIYDSDNVLNTCCCACWYTCFLNCCRENAVQYYATDGGVHRGILTTIGTVAIKYQKQGDDDTIYAHKVILDKVPKEKIGGLHYGSYEINDLTRLLPQE